MASRVSVSVNGAQKHMFPVPESCPLWRRNDIFGANHTICKRRDGVPLKNQVSMANAKSTLMERVSVLVCFALMIV